MTDTNEPLVYETTSLDSGLNGLRLNETRLHLFSGEVVTAFGIESIEFEDREWHLRYYKDTSGLDRGLVPLGDIERLEGVER